MRSTCLLDGLAYIYVIALNRKKKYVSPLSLRFRENAKNRPVDLSDVTERGRRNWPAARNLRFCRTSHEHHTNVTRTFSELWELNHAFPGKRNFYLLLLYR